MWRESLTEILSHFFSLSQQGLQTGHWLCGVNFRGKIHLKRTIFIFIAFGRWPNCIYASRGTFCLEIQFWNFFRQFIILSQKFFGFGKISLTFFSIPPSTSPQELLKDFFLEKPNTCLTFSNFEQKRSLVWLGFYSRTVIYAFYVSKWTLRVKKFSKKVFHLFFWTLMRKFAHFVKVFLPALTDCIYMSIGMFWGKQMTSEKDVVFLGI